MASWCLACPRCIRWGSARPARDCFLLADVMSVQGPLPEIGGHACGPELAARWGCRARLEPPKRCGLWACWRSDALVSVTAPAAIALRILPPVAKWFLLTFRCCPSIACIKGL